jgi:hypothetical protein
VFDCRFRVAVLACLPVLLPACLLARCLSPALFSCLASQTRFLPSKRYLEMGYESRCPAPHVLMSRSCCLLAVLLFSLTPHLPRLSVSLSPSPPVSPSLSLSPSIPVFLYPSIPLYPCPSPSLSLSISPSLTRFRPCVYRYYLCVSSSPSGGYHAVPSSQAQSSAC